MGAFSPIMMLHGAGKREPWYFSELSLENYRKFAKLHTDLFPYIYSYAYQASETGFPIIRAMALEFPNDPNIWNELCENQYCFGSELLIAPVHYSFSRTRPVYLPIGKWRDFWTGALLDGGSEISCRAEINQIPVFARAGAIIPMLDPSPLVMEKAENKHIPSASENLKIFVYPGHDGFFRLYDGTAFSWSEDNQGLTITDSPVSRFVSVQIVDGNQGHKLEVFENQTPLKSHLTNLDGETNFTRVLISSGDLTFFAQ
jgi:alpha-glucosidase (family GH31 glycosyl hydrolase)